MNKRILKLLFVLIVSAVTLLICTVSSSAALLGDITDGDNLVTANDARTILRAAVGLESLTAEQADIADTDGDGKITATDARTEDLMVAHYVRDNTSSKDYSDDKLCASYGIEIPFTDNEEYKKYCCLNFEKKYI